MTDVIVISCWVVSGVCLILIGLMIRCRWAFEISTALFLQAAEAFQEGDFEAGKKLRALGSKESDRAEAMFIRRLMRI